MAEHFEHRRLARRIFARAPIECVFPLLTPEGERHWVPDWAPVYLASDNPSEEAGTVFLTHHGGETTVWTVIEVDHASSRARYVRHTEGSRTAIVSVQCQREADGTTVDVAYDVTALSPAGNESVKRFEADFAGAIDGWVPALESHAS